jgi:hypothetical protein
MFNEQTSERSEIAASYASRTGLAARAGRLAGPGQTASDRLGTGAQAWLRMQNPALANYATATLLVSSKGLGCSLDIPPIFRS